MNLQATLPAGTTDITVHGLHQWDYGRKLEIESESLRGRGLVEVHFAFAGMPEAVVRACSVDVKTVTATIPDTCLEQATPIFAWVFCLDDTEGFTALKVTMPVIARTRPSGTATEPPASYTDKYTEVITAANEALARLYSKDEVDAALGAYITDVDTIIGGDE